MKEALLNNRLAFITCHREKRDSRPGIELFHGAPAFFKNAFVYDLDQLDQVPANFEVHLPDWVEKDEQLLEKNNWVKSDSMIYMLLKGNNKDWRINDQVEIKRITGAEDITTFCQVQSRGFNNDQQNNDPWYPYIKASSLKQANNKDHYFYMAYLEGQPVGVTVSYYHQNMMGIYSVTTIEEFRKRGVSVSLMNTVIRDAEEKAGHITLQTMAGSYAESFYLRLGFEPVFACDIYKQKDVSTTLIAFPRKR